MLEIKHTFTQQQKKDDMTAIICDAVSSRIIFPSSCISSPLIALLTRLIGTEPSQLLATRPLILKNERQVRKQFNFYLTRDSRRVTNAESVEYALLQLRVQLPYPIAED